MLILPAILVRPAHYLRSRKRLSLVLLILGFFTFVIEPYHHVQTAYPISRPAKPLDPPYSTTCPVGSLADVAASTPRESAVLFMLARNSEAYAAAKTIRNLEARWNRHYNYPWVLLNDQPWERGFKAKINAALSPGTNITFAEIPRSMWGWPSQFSERQQEKAMATWDRYARGMTQEFVEGTHVQKASYHHMCRFNSGLFYDHPDIKPYKWYWRVEPGVSFSCDIPYDPFHEMVKRGHRYGYTVALWEVGSLSPTLFRAASDFAETLRGKKSALWNAMHDASWAPWFVRRFVLPLWPSKNRYGDQWTSCHFWSNFEIADLDFFRGREYRDFFAYLDGLGGFHYERWGDAPVHSLAAGMLLQPEEIHYFQDVGYKHPPFQHCPNDVGLGCNCKCDDSKAVNQFCLGSVRRPVLPEGTRERALRG
ncbi:O-glycoside alpha-1,2-mannosyltransferase 4 [Sphaceloma murrayae]|uniref:O-glycoside alpha-1,2-mannosyltransferase 4 n=1 Tax=Sphaceloma murrayae TaxID=2082308 RepID=A0A2K1QK78_9PEZI|nr:O-glycoside alpha-1,2-mannosyltransferase 4 [Sphaceloma murrayae]